MPTANRIATPRRLLAACLCIALVSACSYRQSVATAIVGGGLVVAGAVTWTANRGGDESYGLVVPIMLIGVGGAMGIGGLLGMAMTRRGARTADEREDAAMLIKRSRAAAAAGDCRVAIANAGFIERAAPDLYAADFVTDAAIAHCVGSAAPAQ